MSYCIVNISSVFCRKAEYDIEKGIGDQCGKAVSLGFECGIYKRYQILKWDSLVDPSFVILPLRVELVRQYVRELELRRVELAVCARAVVAGSFRRH